MAKKQETGFVGSADGVAVAKSGTGYDVAFEFSNSLVNKIKTVPGAEFDRDDGMWRVPATSAEQLGEVVPDMRDFVRNDGVQVKDVEGGGKQVIFDYDKRLTQVIGAVNGAEFDSQARVWNVPANSKALVAGEGQTTSYLDMAVNKMRGMSIESAKDREAIKDLAAAAAGELGAKPGISYAKPEQSYSGEIVRANGSCAVQLSEVKDAEQGKVAFMVIHDKDNVGDVFKGQKLRIDYDGKMHADVRTLDLVKEQQADREKLTAVANGLVDGADVKNASIKHGVKYSGQVMGTTDSMILLSGGRNAFTMHRRDIMGGADIRHGQKLDISYKDGKGFAVDTEKKREMAGAER